MQAIRFKPNRLSTWVASALVSFAGVTDMSTAHATALEEVIVTSQKQSEDVQSVPIAMSAFTGDRLQEMGVTKVTDVMAHVPNVHFFSFFGESQTPSLCFRGICLNQQFSDSFEAPVAMYTDEVYVGSAFAQSLQLFDIERIEVLKGPQGTLYGRNTTGGLVNVITKKPTSTFDASASVEYGSYNTQILEGAVGGPIADGVNGRLALRTHRADGYMKPVTGSLYGNDVDSQAARGALDFIFSDDVTFLLSTNYFKVDEGQQVTDINGLTMNGKECNASQLQSGNCSGVPYIEDMTGNDINGKFDSKHWAGYSIPGGGKPKNFVESFGATGTLDWNLGSWQLTSITGYNVGRKDYIEDLDGDLGLGLEDRLYAKAKTFSEEVRASGDYGDSTWMVGVFGYHDSRIVGTELIPSTDYADRSKKTDTSAALFSNWDIPVVDTVHLLLGGRYTWETRDVVFSRTSTFVPDADHEKRDVSSNHFDWKAVLQWKPGYDTLIYGSVATAFRSANMNNQFIYGSVSDSDRYDRLKPVDPEYLTAYEVGYKSDFFNNRVRFNAAAFYYDFKKLQYLLAEFDATTGRTITRLSNVGDVKVTGFETDLAVQATEHLQLTLGYGDTHSKLDSDVVVDRGDKLVPVDGNSLPFSNPSANAGVIYDLPLGEMGKLSLQADYAWEDDHYFSINSDARSEGKAYGVTNVRAIWTSPDAHYTVELHGDNIFNKQYYVFAGQVSDGTQGVVWGKPVWYGVKVGYKY